MFSGSKIYLLKKQSQYRENDQKMYNFFLDESEGVYYKGRLENSSRKDRNNSTIRKIDLLRFNNDQI